MSARHFHFSLFGGAAQEPRAEAETMRLGRMAGFGLTLAVIGWGMLLGEAAVTNVLAVQDPPMLAPTFHDDFMDVSKTLIFSGFALALIGALRTGFGALNRFFEAVLVRSGQRAQGLPATPVAETYKEEVVVAAARIGRPYRTFPDGSVEVETILGNRRFRTMAEARDFI